MASYTNKFIAFVDILGFKGMVEASEADEALLDQLIEITGMLGKGAGRDQYEQYGPLTCPNAPHIDKHLNFCVTQISDCVIISSEKSPAGLINLVTNCWQISIRLLQSGNLCRGFVTAGNVYHTSTQIIGPAYQTAYASESTVTAFKRMANEKGTPFIEIDDAVSKYVSDQTDQCVKTMFERLTSFDGSKYAIFPFKRLEHEFGFGGIFGQFEPQKHLDSVQTIRGWIATMKEKVLENCKGGGPSAAAKAQHYLEALDRQLIALDKTEQMIILLQQPAARE